MKKKNNARVKRTLMFTVIVVGLFIATGLIYQLTTNKAISDNNPYQTTDLDEATKKSLLDPEYQDNIILPSELEEKVTKGEEVFVYFFSPTCKYCQEATPSVNDVFEEGGVLLYKYNLLEFEEGWDIYGIPGTPTILHFNNAEIVGQIAGAKSKEEFQNWLRDEQIQ